MRDVDRPIKDSENRLSECETPIFHSISRIGKNSPDPQ